MTALRYDRNRARVEEVRDHLRACDAGFAPPLGSRVAIPDYAAKLVANAERFEAWSGARLVGLVAVYCNDPERSEAFVTNVSVVPDQTRRGLGRRLLEDAIAHVRERRFGRLALSVDRNAPALALYRSLRFEIAAQTDETLHLALDLRGKVEP